MTLGFSTQINGESTNFIEKIWCGIQNILPDSQINEFFESGLMEDNYDFSYDMFPAKIHTIRKDEKDRWKVGNKIHFVIGNRTPKRFQFAPVLFVKAIQKIRILWDKGEPCVYLWASSEAGFMPFAYKGYNEISLKALAVNDGFESVESFFKYFSEDFEGKIIHWTNTRYHF